MKLHRNLPKTERFGIGQKIERSFLEVLEMTYIASYLSPEHKIPALGRAISQLDIVKFFMQLAWENKLIPTEQYSIIIAHLGEIGRMLGGWKKGLEKKTPARQ